MALHSSRHARFASLVVAACLIAAGPSITAHAECPADPNATQQPNPLLIYGTVTGLGVLCVNGLAIAVDDDTRIHRDGRRTRKGALGLGQVVRVETRDAEAVTANAIDIDYAIAGPAERVRGGVRRVAVLGIEVEARRDALIRGADGVNRAFHEITRGAHLEVSGLRRADGSILASRIDLRPAGSPAHVTGVAIPVGRDTMYVGRVRGRTADRMGFDRELRGERVQLRGKWNSRTRMLNEAIVRRRPLLPRQGRAASIQGYATTTDHTDTFSLSETPLRISNHLESEISFPVDSLVRVSGRVGEPTLQLDALVIDERSKQVVDIVIAPARIAIEAPPQAPIVESAVPDALPAEAVDAAAVETPAVGARSKTAP